jgi:ribose transport system ATP-binding protein
MNEHLRFQDVFKDYGPTRALDGATFSIMRGEIHGLVGENGAGKSTVAKLISGDVRPTSGEIFLNGEKVRDNSPTKAREAGVAIVHQWGDLAPNLSIVDNIFLGNEIRNRWGMVNRSEMKQRATRILKDFGVELELSVLVQRLSPGEQQIVSIAKALSQEKSGFLIVDEGGASLDREETEVLSRVLRRLRDSHVTILYISHLLNNVKDLCDRITVLRNGRYIQTVFARDVSVGQLGALVVGRDLKEVAVGVAEPKRAERTVRLRIDGVQWQGNSERYSLQVREGEILGITGPAGAGKSELLRTIMGLMPKADGVITLDNREIDDPSPARMIRSGVAFLPEDRLAEGLAANRSIEENISLPTLWKWRRFFLNMPHLKENAEHAGSVVRLKRGSIEDPVLSLSGGNQQKTAVAKWINSSYDFLLFDEPYKGIDIGAKEDINGAIRQLARDGRTVIVVSTEFSDLTSLVDRLLVMVNRKIVGDLSGSEINSQNIITHYQSVIK